MTLAAFILVLWFVVSGVSALAWIFEWWPQPDSSRVALTIMMPLVVLACVLLAIWLVFIAIREAGIDLRSWVGDRVGDIS